MSPLINYVTGMCLIIGSLFILSAAIGILRLPDVYSRMHAASKAGTLGSCVIMIGAGLFLGDIAILARIIAGIIFFLITAPIAAHVLANAARKAGFRQWVGSKDEVDLSNHE